MGLRKSLCYQRFADIFKKKNCKNRGASAKNQIPANNRRLQTASEGNSEKKIQNKIISGVEKIPARIISPSRY
jgi:hypothetical protein